MKLRPEYAHLSLVMVGAPAPAAWQEAPVAVAARPRQAFQAQVTIASVLLNAPSRAFIVSSTTVTNTSPGEMRIVVPARLIERGAT